MSFRQLKDLIVTEPFFDSLSCGAVVNNRWDHDGCMDQECPGGWKVWLPVFFAVFVTQLFVIEGTKPAAFVKGLRLAGPRDVLNAAALIQVPPEILKLLSKNARCLSEKVKIPKFVRVHNYAFSQTIAVYNLTGGVIIASRS